MHLNYSTIAFTRKPFAAFLGLIMLLTGCVNDQELEFNPTLNIPPTCTDGLKNQDETAVDCGGACSDTCGDEILAVCKDELNPNIVSSIQDERTLQLSQVEYRKSYSYYNALEIRGYDRETDNEITIVLSIPKLPVGNMKFQVVKDLNTQDESLQAEVTIIPDYGMYRYSKAGTVYLRKESSEMYHIEFCDLLLETIDYWNGIRLYKYQGNLQFTVSESDY